MSCAQCDRYFASSGTGGDVFPEEHWEIRESRDIQVGTHGGGSGMTGWAICRACGQPATFDCTYGPGYQFWKKS